MSYTEEQCMPLATFKEKIKGGAYGEGMTYVNDVAVYKNEKGQLRIKLDITDSLKENHKNVNCLAATTPDGLVINIKSFENSISLNNQVKQLNLAAVEALMF